MSARSQPSADGGNAAAPTPALVCDLCEWPMPVPEHCRRSGEIIGLLTCSACIEDDLATRQLEAQP